MSIKLSLIKPFVVVDVVFVVVERKKEITKNWHVLMEKKVELRRTRKSRRKLHFDLPSEHHDAGLTSLRGVAGRLIRPRLSCAGGSVSFLSLSLSAFPGGVLLRTWLRTRRSSRQILSLELVSHRLIEAKEKFRFMRLKDASARDQECCRYPQVIPHQRRAG